MHGSSASRWRIAFERGRGREPRHRVTGDDDIPRLALERRGQRRHVLDPFEIDIVAAALQRADHERLVLGRVLDQQELKS